MSLEPSAERDEVSVVHVVAVHAQTRRGLHTKINRRDARTDRVRPVITELQQPARTPKRLEREPPRPRGRDDGDLQPPSTGELDLLPYLDGHPGHRVGARSCQPAAEPYRAAISRPRLADQHPAVALLAMPAGLGEDVLDAAHCEARLQTHREC